MSVLTRRPAARGVVAWPTRRQLSSISAWSLCTVSNIGYSSVQPESNSLYLLLGDQCGRSGHSDSTSLEMTGSPHYNSSHTRGTFGWNSSHWHTCTGSFGHLHHTCGKSCSQTQDQRRILLGGQCSQNWMWHSGTLPTAFQCGAGTPPSAPGPGIQ